MTDPELREHAAEAPVQMTRDEIMRVANEAADSVITGMRWYGDTRELDAVNLVVNMLGTMLDRRGATVDEAMDENYDGGAEAVRSWWPGWERTD